MTSLPVRLVRHARAWGHMRELRKLNLTHLSLEEMVTGVFNYAHGFFGTDQSPVEIIEALRAIKQLQPRFVIEIGTAGGGTLLMWSRVAHPEAVIISIDLPGGDFGGGSSRLRAAFFRRMGLPKQKIHIIRGDSHDPATLTLATSYLGTNKLDFLFIDGDHSRNGVRSDYATFGPLVRRGGLIAFHDIAVQSPRYGVAELWRELSRTERVKSIVDDPSTYGIGLLYS